MEKEELIKVIEFYLKDVNSYDLQVIRNLFELVKLQQEQIEELERRFDDHLTYKKHEDAYRDY